MYVYTRSMPKIFEWESEIEMRLKRNREQLTLVNSWASIWMAMAANHVIFECFCWNAIISRFIPCNKGQMHAFFKSIRAIHTHTSTPASQYIHILLNDRILSENMFRLQNVRIWHLHITYISIKYAYDFDIWIDYVFEIYLLNFLSTPFKRDWSLYELQNKASRNNNVFTCNCLLFDLSLFSLFHFIGQKGWRLFETQIMTALNKEKLTSKKRTNINGRKATPFEFNKF